MSKGVLMAAAAVITLILFRKPITGMLNGIIGGEFGAEDSKRDTTTSQGAAYDPLSEAITPPAKSYWDDLQTAKNKWLEVQAQLTSIKARKQWMN